MKTVMKKLLSIMLVAILLVSALPFAAFADGTGFYADVSIFYDDNGDGSYGNSVATGEFENVATLTQAQVLALYSGYNSATMEVVEWKMGDGLNMSAISGTTATLTDDCAIDLYLKVKTSGNGQQGGGNVEGIPGNGGNGGSGNTTTPDGEPAPDPTVIACTLTVDYKLSGYEVRTHNTTVGTPYGDFVGVPARNGYEFRGWYSEREEGFIDVVDDLIMGNDTITAIWSQAAKYNLTLDENRGAEETVNRGLQVTYGEAIGDRLYTPVREGYVFMGWKLNGTYIDKDTIWSIPGDGTAYAQWRLESDTEDVPMGGNAPVADGKVYLEIYVNGDTSSAEKKVEITDLAKDNKITRSEVESVVKKYVTAKAGYSLAYEGLFDEESWWWYVRDPETDGESTIIVNRDGDDYIYVMVNNVKSVSATTKPADSTNPKTGDMIGVALAAMMSTGGAALTLIKKRKF